MMMNLIGMVFGKLTVIELGIKKPSSKLRWKCQCDCGNEKEVEGSHLKSGRIQSCGCLHRERITTHGGITRHPMYWIWVDMIRRCNNSTRKDFLHYGERGIQVDSRWMTSFETFISDMGDRPSPRHTLDRKNVNGHYEVSNCRWLDKSLQNSNKRNNKLIFYKGKNLLLKQWSDVMGIPESTIRTRLKKGLSIDAALSKRKKRKGTNPLLSNQFT